MLYLSYAKRTLMHEARDAFPVGMRKPLRREITRFLLRLTADDRLDLFPLS